VRLSADRVTVGGARRDPRPSTHLHRCHYHCDGHDHHTPSIHSRPPRRHVDRLQVKEAVEAGETAPRSYWQSVKPLTLPTVIE